MTPLVVTAALRGPLELGGTQAPIALDGLLAAVVARQRALPRPASPDELVPLEIPVQLEPGGRFHLASCGVPDGLLGHVTAHIHRPPVARQLEQFTTLRQIDTGSEPNKQLRKPKIGALWREMRWWCIGDADAIRALLLDVRRLGHRRAHGRGEVTRWTVEPCATWDGFPVMREGKPLRNLPLDWPGLVEPVTAWARITFPFWMRELDEPLAVPKGLH